MSINHVTVSGNLTRDIELRTTASGMVIASFGIAVNERVPSKNGDSWEDRPNFFDCTGFGSRWEKLAQYVGKGSKVAIGGKLRWSQWEKDGQKRSKVEIIADDIELMSKSEDSVTPASKLPEVNASSVYDEDIPFN